MRDMHSNIGAIRVIAPVALGTTGTGQTGKVIDLQNYQGVEFIISYGSITATNATVTPVIKDGDVTGTLASVADANLLGLEANAGIAAGTPRTSNSNKNVTKRIGYIGTKRYVTCNLINTISAGIIGGVIAILGRPGRSPVAT